MQPKFLTIKALVKLKDNKRDSIEMEEYGDEEEVRFQAIVFGLGSEVETNRPQQDAEDDARI